MYTHDLFTTDHFCCDHRIIHIHSEVTSDRHNGKIRGAVFWNHGKFCGKAGVSCIIKAAFLGFDQETAGITSIAAIRKSTAVCRGHKMNLAEIKCFGTEIHRMYFFVALFRNPVDDLEVGYHSRLRLLCQCDQVCNVISMTV
ncbi:hypothetical protein FQZ97_678950 [compost metagenome]